MKIYLILFLVFVIIFCSVNSNIETYENNYEIIYKNIDNTSIKLINDIWNKDFKDRFISHEPYTNIKLKELLEDLPNNSHIIDAGAHVGDTGLYLAKILDEKYKEKNIKVIMIEPDKTKINFINNMAKLNNLNNIVTKNIGISDKKGKAKIDKTTHPGGWKIIENNKNGNIIIDTLDNICNNLNISLIHLDVEGMEYKCLLGSKNILKNTKYVMIELNDLSNNRKNEINFLKNNNFIEFKDNKIKKENGNVLFIKNI
jgi:FkbM family methyltransferase